MPPTGIISNELILECVEVGSLERMNLRINPDSDPVVERELTGQALKGCADTMALNNFSRQDTDHALVLGTQMVLRGTGSNEVCRLQDLSRKPVALVDIVCAKDMITERPRART